MSAGKVDGMAALREKIGRQIAKIEGTTLDGLMAAGLHLQGESQKLAPVDTGNLRNSAYTRKSGKMEVEVGFGAAYAAPVHEDLEAHHEVGQAKYLETPFASERQTMLGIIRDRAKV